MATIVIEIILLLRAQDIFFCIACGAVKAHRFSFLCKMPRYRCACPHCSCTKYPKKYKKHRSITLANGSSVRVCDSCRSRHEFTSQATTTPATATPITPINGNQSIISQSLQFLYRLFCFCYQFTFELN